MKRFFLCLILILCLGTVVYLGYAHLSVCNIRADIDGRLITYSPARGYVYYEPKTGDIEPLKFPVDVNVYNFWRIKDNEFLVYDNQKNNYVLCDDKNVLKRFSFDFIVLDVLDYKNGVLLMTKHRQFFSYNAEIYYLNLENDSVTKLTECADSTFFFVSDGEAFTFLNPESNTLSVYLSDGSIIDVSIDADLQNLSCFLCDNTLAGVTNDFSLVNISIPDGSVTVIKKNLKCIADGIFTEDKKYFIYAFNDITAMFSRSAIRAVRVSDGFDTKILSDDELYIEDTNLMWE